MTKRLSSLVLAVVMAFTLAFSVGAIAFTEKTAAASVTDSGTCGDDVTWTLENGVLTISGTGEMTTYNGSSYYPWADYKDYVKQIVIESGVTNVSDMAFYYFWQLKSVTIPETVVSIGYYTFGCCTALSEISIAGDGLTSIDVAAFYKCSSLGSVSLPESLTTIGGSAFENCSSLTEITIPASVTSVGSYAFYDCSVLETVTFDGDAPSLGTGVWTSAVTIMYHSSKDGWDTAQESWSLPSGSSWVDLDSIVSADDFAVDYETLSLDVGSSASVSTNADEYVLSLLSWSSSDISVASVSRNGLVTGLSAGTAVIAVQSEDGTYYAECTVTVTGEYSYLPAAKTVIDSDEAEVTSNISDNNYTKWSSVVNSYLYENDDGTLTRVEYTSDGVVVEVYSSELELVSTQTIENELSLFGGFYSGEEYNYLVFGQTNSGESDETEVIRVIKYSKDWERLDSYSVYGANTTTPFDAGSLRMTEVDDLLYIYTCHVMYSGHQANMTFVIDTSDMSLEYSYTDTGETSYGYVSHSFNQFIQTDGENVYRVDHGDSSLRAVSIIRSAAGSSITNVSYTEAFEILGTAGDNNTGVSVGGFELSTDNCIIAGNSVDMSDSSTYSASGTRNIFITVTNKNLSSTSTIWLTDYTSDDEITVRTPQLVKINSEIFLVMWEEYTSDGITTKLVLINGDGEILTDITELKVRLSDCQPVVTSDGIVTWYVTDGSNVIFYQINPYRLSETVVKDSIEKATVTLNGTYTYTGSEITPEISVELEDGTVLTEGTDYTVEYSDNINVGTAVVTITGTGNYTGTVTASFDITETGHTLVETARVDSTCIEAGTAAYWTCSVCGKMFADEEGTTQIEEAEVIPATGHSWDEGTVTSEATAKEDGEIIYTCTVCGETYAEVIPASGEGLFKDSDTGNWYYYVDGEIDTSFTGLAENDYGTWYVEEGIITFEYTGLAEDEDGIFWYVSASKVSSDSGIKKIDGAWYLLEDGAVASGYTGFASNSSGTWYVEEGVITFEYTGFAEDGDGVTWYVSGSKVSTYTGIKKISGTWYYLEAGCVALDYTGLAENEYGTWYVEEGVIDFGYTGLYEDEDGTLWYVLENKVMTSKSGIKKIDGVWYFLEDGAVAADYTGLSANDYGTWYIEEGVITFDYTGLAEDEDGITWYVYQSKVQASKTSVLKVDGVWYYVVEGAVAYDYTGLGTNTSGTWYVINGIVDFSYTGTVTIDGVIYTVVNSKVTS